VWWTSLRALLEERVRRHGERFESHVRDVLAVGSEQGMLRVQDLELATLAFLNGVLAEAVSRSTVESELEQGRSLLRSLRGAEKEL